MSDLMKSPEGLQVISSRQIAEETGKMHKHVLADIINMCVRAEVKILSAEISTHDENQDVIVLEAQYETGGAVSRKAKEFLLNEMAAELLATGYDVKRRLAVLRLIKKMKEALEQRPALPDFKNPAEAARAWAAEYEEKIALAEQNESQHKMLVEQSEILEKQAPKVEFADMVTASEDCVLISNFARSLGIGTNSFFRMLREDRILQRSGSGYNLPFQYHINQGYFKVEEVTFKRGKEGEVGLNYRAKVTPKGQQWLAKKYGKKQ